MLSQDLEMMFREFDRRKNAKEELHLSATTVQMVEFVLRDCIQQAKCLEANVAPRTPILVDLADPKVTMFPRKDPGQKRSAPTAGPVVFYGIDWGKPDDGGDAA
ncbi:hypothetical protein [uncultured Roseibium sp.]|uniref:hypothetical protein n=1 Tax=uncultured Roseibium sp. TaxID=1936171 RepID=UPI00321713E7